MDSNFLNARSPMRLLEKGLHGGLGAGNLGLVVAGPGIGKTAFLVGVALDTLLRGGHVLHVSLDQTVAHVRAYYDTLFEDLASSAHLEQEATIHADIDRRRSIRAYPPADFSASKLREAVKVETEAGSRPDMLVVEGFDLTQISVEEAKELKALAVDLQLELWHSVAAEDELVPEVPTGVKPIADAVSVIVALEPENEHVALRSLKDHDTPDLSTLRVALDPKTLLLIRS